jgi:hypothetical protein
MGLREMAVTTMMATCHKCATAPCICEIVAPSKLAIELRLVMDKAASIADQLGELGWTVNAGLDACMLVNGTPTQYRAHCHIYRTESL